MNENETEVVVDDDNYDVDLSEYENLTEDDGDGNQTEPTETEEEEEDLPGLAEDGADHRADRLAAVADRQEERDHVVRGTDEDAAEDDPQGDGRPAELGGKDGPHNRTRARDGREMVAEDHRPGMAKRIHRP